VTGHKLAPDFAGVVAAEFGEESLARDIFEEFLGRQSYERAFATRLVKVAAARVDGSPPSWPLRCAAVLMLETQLCAEPVRDDGELDFILRCIADTVPGGLTYPPGPSVLAEGYSTSQRATFLAELRARLSRLERIHQRIRHPGRNPDALRDFLDVSRQECRLTLARYLFDPREVARRILTHVRTSRGMVLPFASSMVEEEADAMLNEWPAYERGVVGELLELAAISWVDESTSSRLNALVEYPLGTVALVVKLPGSTLEIEIKRAGRPGDHPLSVVFERDGVRVPPSHRLDGGSMSGSARAEANGAARFGRIYRRIHGRRAPISQTIALRSIYEIPCAGGRAQLLDYLTDPTVFGNGFAEMRRDMDRSIRSFCQERGVERLGTPGELGMSVDFLAQVAPTQAVLGATSSFRLDRLAAYLADDGPDLYFRQGLGIEPSTEDSRRLDETLLDELLGKVTPVDVAYLRQGQFIDAVFAEPANRRRADEVFLDLNTEAGRFWGTLMALKGYTNGESLVGRNVGLKSVWENGAWRVRIIFLDHDQLSVPTGRFSALDVLRGWKRDAAHILGDPGQGRKCVTDWLAVIYRVDAAMAQRGRSALLCAAVDAACLTRDRLANDPQLRVFFKPDCLKDALDWEAAVIAYLHTRRLGGNAESAVTAGRERMEAQGCSEDFIGCSLDSLHQFTDFLEQHAALLLGGRSWCQN
jgi:hypothetical protein